MKTGKHPLEKLQERFEEVTDPRASNVRHRLLDIIVLTICGLISGADSWTEIEAYGNAKLGWFSKYLELPHGIPSHDTLGRVFAQMDPAEVQSSFLKCVGEIAELLAEQIAIDGKQLRRSHDRVNGKAAIHLVSAWGVGNGLVLGQEKVSEKN